MSVREDWDFYFGLTAQLAAHSSGSFMKILPLFKFDLQTSLSVPEVLKRLQSEIAPEAFFWPDDNKYFEGELFEQQFLIKRAIHFRQPALPIIEGQVLPQNAGSIVKIKMRLDRITAVISVWSFCLPTIWLLKLLIGFFEKSGSMFDWYQRDGLIVAVAPLGWIAFLYVFLSGPFWIEVSKQKKKLITLLS